MGSVYTREAMQHFLRPKNARAMEAPDGIGRAVNKVGDVCTFALEVKDGAIVDAAFQAQGCAATIIAASVATELLVGRPVADAAALTLDEVAQQVGGLPEAKLSRANVAVVAIHVAAKDAS